MKITWFGHSTFELFDGKTRIWIDPFFTGNPFAPNWEDLELPDLILVSHDHGDHVGDALAIAEKSNAQLGAIADICYHWTAQGVPADKILFGGNGYNIGGTVCFNDIKIHVTQAIHSSGHGVPVGYVLTFADGTTIYHAGDTALFSDMALIAERHTIDLALLPIGDHFTMDSYDAAKACAYLEAKAVCPMHYATFPILTQDANQFEEHLKTFSPDTKCFVLQPNVCFAFEASK